MLILLSRKWGWGDGSLDCFPYYYDLPGAITDAVYSVDLLWQLILTIYTVDNIYLNSTELSYVYIIAQTIMWHSSMHLPL